MPICTTNLHLRDSAAGKENITLPLANEPLTFFRHANTKASNIRNRTVKLARCCENNCAVVT